MIRLQRQIDQTIRIGHDILVQPTDIDAHGVRVLAGGRMLGGEDDGLPFEKAHELAPGGSFFIGPHIAVTLLSIEPRLPAATFGILCPLHMAVTPGESAGGRREEA